MMIPVLISLSLVLVTIVNSCEQQIYCNLWPHLYCDDCSCCSGAKVNEINVDDSNQINQYIKHLTIFVALCALVATLIIVCILILCCKVNINPKIVIKQYQWILVLIIILKVILKLILTRKMHN
mmetsp:Transcript_10705/g.13327  ORF Transcript_10705/g.13327 Transcript_10705/m.13327 type:complete len:124 (-) Transcript_10705:28-399(-)